MKSKKKLLEKAIVIEKSKRIKCDRRRQKETVKNKKKKL